MPRERLLTVAEVADHMRVSSMTVYRLIKAGALKAVRVGKNYRIRTRDLDAYLQSSSVDVRPYPPGLSVQFVVFKTRPRSSGTRESTPLSLLWYIAANRARSFSGTK